jgi:hypothetical protein
MKTIEKRNHDEMLERLVATPRLVGIQEPVRWSAQKVNVFQPGSVDQLTDIDLLYKTESDIWVVEYKTVPGYAKKAQRQLDIAKEFVQQEFRVTPKGLYVCSPQLYVQRLF